MKRIILLSILLITTLFLSGCDLFGGNDEPPVEYDICELDPSDPSCQEEVIVDCDVTPNDPSCEVPCDEHAPEYTDEYIAVYWALQSIQSKVNYRMTVDMDLTSEHDVYDSHAEFYYDLEKNDDGTFYGTLFIDTDLPMFNPLYRGGSATVDIARDGSADYYPSSNYVNWYYARESYPVSVFPGLDIGTIHNVKTVISDEMIPYTKYEASLFSPTGLDVFYDTYGVFLSGAGIAIDDVMNQWQDIDLDVMVDPVNNRLRQLTVDFSGLYDVDELVLILSFDQYNLIANQVPSNAEFHTLPSGVDVPKDASYFETEIMELDSISVQDTFFDEEHDAYYILDQEAAMLYQYDVETTILQSLEIDDDSVAIYGYDNELYIAVQLQGSTTDYDVVEDGKIVVVDMDTFTIDRFFDVDVDPYDMVIDQQGHVVVTSASGQHTTSFVYEDGNEVAEFSTYMGTKIEYNEGLDQLYLMSTQTSPLDLDVLVLNNDGTVQRYHDSEYHGDFPLDTEYGFSGDGTYIFNATGVVFSASDVASEDMVYQQYLRYHFTTIAPYNDAFIIASDGDIAIFDMDGLEPVTRLYSGLEVIDLQQTSAGFIALGYDASGLLQVVDFDPATTADYTTSCDNCCERDQVPALNSIDVEDAKVEDLAINALVNFVRYSVGYELEEVCTMFTVFTYRECESAFDDTLSTHKDLFDDDYTATMVDDNTVTITVSHKDGDGYFTITMDIVEITEGGSKVVKIAGYDIVATTTFVPAETDDLIALLDEMSTFELFSDELCNEYFVGYNADCSIYSEIMTSFENVMVLDEVVQLEDGLFEVLYIHPETTEISWSMYMVLEPARNHYIITFYEIENTSTFSSEEQFHELLDAFVEDAVFDENISWCDVITDDHNRQDCYDIFPTDRTLGSVNVEMYSDNAYYVRFEFLGLPNFILEFEMRVSLNQDFEPVLNAYMIYYGYENTSLSIYDAMNLFSTVVMDEIDGIEHAQICQTYFIESMQEICINELNPIYGSDAPYTMDASQNGLRRFEITLMNQYNGETTRYTVTYDLDYELGRWLIVSLEIEHVEPIPLEVAEQWVIDWVDSLKRLNAYEYCYTTMPGTWEDIDDFCIEGFYGMKGIGYHFNLVSVEQGTSGQNFNVVLDLLMPDFGSRQFLTLTLYDRGTNTGILLQDYYMIIDFVDGDDILMTPYHLFNQTLHDFLTAYTDDSVSSEDLYNQYIIPNYDVTEFITARLNDVSTIVSIEMLNTTFDVNYLGNVTYIVDLQITYSNENVETITQMFHYDYTNSKISPVSSDVTYQVTEDELRWFMETIFDYVYHPFLEHTLTCADLVSTNYTGTCEQVEDVFGHPQSFEITSQDGNVFTIIVHQLDEETWEITQVETIVEVEVVNGQILFVRFDEVTE